MMFGFAIVGLIFVAFGLLFILGSIGGRATAMFSLGRSSLTLKATLGGVFIFIGLIIMGMSTII